MKKMLLYFVLPGIVLGMVYSMGKSAGKREVVPLAAADFEVVQVDQAAASQTPVPPIAKPVNAPRAPQRSQTNVERYQVRQMPRVIETQDRTESVSAPPAANVPYPAPKRSVYDRVERPSELGLMPLRPLDPPAAVERYPAPQQPMLAPSVQQRARVYPVPEHRAAETSAAVDCGCDD